ncbi:hypothetical protein [Streptomyces sp. NPDC002825]|uniref:hypothetical protein n=1 Tax=Streptomyces sp. NPDC002825 TaxID=3154666 RepID=UPI0033342508
MFDETHENDTGTPRQSAPGQLRLQLPHQSAPVERGRRPQGYDANGAAASWLGGNLNWPIGILPDPLLPF